MITGGSSMAAMIFKAPQQLGKRSMSMSKTVLALLKAIASGRAFYSRPSCTNRSNFTRVVTKLVRFARIKKPDSSPFGPGRISGNLGALLVAKRGFQHRHDAQGISPPRYSRVGGILCRAA